MPQQATARERAQRREGFTGPRRTIVITGNVPAPAQRPPRLAQVERRRPPRRARDLAAHRPDRTAMWAVVLGLFLVLVAAASSQGSTPERDEPQAGASYERAEFGERTLRRGMEGTDVRTLQRLVAVEATGSFGSATERAVKDFQAAAGLEADGVVGRDTRTALARKRMNRHRAAWYGPGFYGNTTACGQKLTPRTRGVAHRKLRCGTRVTIYARGRFTTVKVIDRGPHAHGVEFDLTEATARSLGVRGTEPVRAKV